MPKAMNVVSRRVLPAAIVFGLSFGVYLTCLAPTITWRNEGADSGDLATAVHTLGIAHPPGYPTYILLGWLFHWLPFGDTAYRLNIMSAFWASLSVALVYLTVLDLRSLLRPDRKENISSHLAADVAALALAFSWVLWSQATIAEVYTLNAFFVAAILYLLTNRLLAPKSNYHLPLAALLFGLGLGNHLSVVWLLPAAALLLAAGRRPSTGSGHRPARGQGRAAALLFLAGLSTYAYLPWAAGRNPPVNWGYPITWDRFAWLVEADIYHRFAFALPIANLPSRLASWVKLTGMQLQIPGLFLGLLGLAHIWQRRRLLAISGLALFLLISIYAIGYNTPDSYVYLIPAFTVLAMGLGCGLGFMADLLQPWLGRLSLAGRRLAYLLWAVPLLLPAASLYINYPAQNISADRTAYRYAETVFSLVEPGAIVIADTDPHIFALTYYRYGTDTQARATVVIENLLGYRWYRDNLQKLHPDLVIASTVDNYRSQLMAIIYDNRTRPIYLTGPDPVLFERFQWAPLGPLYRLPPT